MKINVDAKSEIRKVRKALKQHKAKVPKIIVTSINNTGKKSLAATQAKVARASGIRRKAVNKRITGMRRHALASVKGSSYQAVVFVRSEMTIKSSEAYGGRKVSKYNRDLLKQSNIYFEATMPTGHTGVFFNMKTKAKKPTKMGSYAGRVIKRGARKGTPITRRPIKEMNPNLRRYKQVAIDAFKSETAARLPDEIQKQIKRHIK